MPAATAEQKAALVRAGQGTRWASGNPGRRPRTDPMLPTPQELAAPHASEAMKTVLAIMRNSKSEYMRLMASRLILDTAVPDDEDKLLKLLEAKLLELQEEAAARRAELQPPPTEPTP